MPRSASRASPAAARSHAASEADLVTAAAAKEAESVVFSTKSARDEAIAAAKVKSRLAYL